MPDSDLHVALPLFKFYFARLWFLLVELILVTSISIVGFYTFFSLLCQFVFSFLHLLNIDYSAYATELEISLMIFISFASFFVVRLWLSDKRDFGWLRIRLVDKSGDPTKFKHKLVRSLASIVSLFCFPINIVLMAAGSRRLLHDYLSWTYVLVDDEDMTTTFYPPVSTLWKVLVVVASILTVAYYGNMVGYADSISTRVIGALIGNSGTVHQTYRGIRGVILKLCERPAN